ncbi:tRNA 4-thiouridine(8) synthase ThiI [Clostridiales bacterium COT073_COT-073]|nr:tRNA 4-thiouridine(8) synthase ThiI [Clostridiales bacterium COT073_COT-073]
MRTAFLVKYGEIAIKGKNRNMFINQLRDRIQWKLNKIGDFTVSKDQGRLFVECQSENIDSEQIIGAIQKVFGILYVGEVKVYDKGDYAELAGHIKEYVRHNFERKDFTFKIEVKRADKSFPYNSMEIASKLGAELLAEFPELKVDVHQPQEKIYVELRANTYIYSKMSEGLGGLPIGCSGKATLMLSGGIDSPVAAYMIAKRGVELNAVYFHSPPYTSERAKDKVVELARIFSDYTGRLKLYVVPFTDIQLDIYEKCPHEELTIIMRRIMMIITEKIAEQTGSIAIVTGESIGQVASQTIQSLNATNAAVKLPVFRPLVAFDKSDIIKIAEKIGTFETSILPYEDCCTIFVAKHPVTKPILEKIEQSEKNLDGMEEKIAKAIAEAEVISIYPKSEAEK